MDQVSARKDVLRTARSLLFRDGSSFTLASLCKDSGLSRSELRRIFPTKSALIAALDQEIVAETLATFSEEKRHEETLQEASQNEPTAPQPDSERIDHRLRVLECAVALLETKIETVSDAQARLAAAHQEMRVREASPSPSSDTAPLPVSEPELAEPPPIAATANLTEPAMPAPFVPPPAVEPQPPQILEDYVFNSKPVEPQVIREMLDNARTLVNGAAGPGSIQQKSEQQNTRLVLVGAAAILLVGLAIGLISVGGTARATQTAASIETPSPVKAAGMTIINATGGIVPEQMTPAAKTLAARAEKGDATAQADLALAYLRGDGVVSNPAAAAGWAGLSATKGHAMGQFLLGALYNSGIKADPHTGFRWMSAAALNGNVKAMHNVAVAFVIGSGIEKNPTEAANWFGKAAARGYRDSAFDLAVLYERGEGVAQSTRRALYWYDNAAAAGDKEAAQRASLLRFGTAELAGNLEASQDLASRLQ